jgi:hypothetical protein
MSQKRIEAHAVVQPKQVRILNGKAVRSSVNGLISIIRSHKNMFLVAQSIDIADTPAELSNDHHAVRQKYVGRKLRIFRDEETPVF